MFLGLDLGTTNIKALAVEADGRVVAEGTAAVGRDCTPDGGVEQDIERNLAAPRARPIRQAVGTLAPRCHRSGRRLQPGRRDRAGSTPTTGRSGR